MIGVKIYSICHKEKPYSKQARGGEQKWGLYQGREDLVDFTRRTNKGNHLGNKAHPLGDILQLTNGSQNQQPGGKLHH